MSGSGGWRLLLICECRISEEYRAVVGSLAIEAATHVGWKVTGGRMMAQPEETRDGLCPMCSAQG